jgi:type II secretion system protein J
MVGFTLIEVLLAITIMSIMMIELYMTLNVTLDTRDMIEREVRTARVGPELLDLIEEDLRRAWVVNLADDKVFKGEARMISGFSADSLSFLCTVDSSMTQQVGLRDVSSDLIETGYRLRPNPDNSELLELWRRQSFHIDDEPLEDGVYQRLHDRVESFELRYYKDRVLSHDPLEEWDAEEEHALPAMIEITLVVEIRPRGLDDVSSRSSKDSRIRTYKRLVMLDPGGAASMRVHPHPPTFTAVTSIVNSGSAANQNDADSDGPESDLPDKNEDDASGSDLDLGDLLDELFGG